MNAEYLFSLLNTIAAGVVRATLAASLLVMVILTMQFVLRRHLSARARYALWLVLILRLVTPAAIPVHFPHSVGQPVSVTGATTSSLSQGVLISVSEPVAVVAQPAARRMNWPLILAGVWLLGTVVLLVRLAVASLRLAIAARRLDKLDDPALIETVESCMSDLGLRRRPEIASGLVGCGPALVGLVRPKLLIPPSCLDLPRTELRMIVLHELAHYRRRDLAVGSLMAVLNAVHWFNPVLWLAFARMRADRELACDETVLSVADRTEASARDYGLVLLKVSALLTDRSPVPGAVGIVESTRTLQRRITMIARYNGRRATMAWAVAAVILLSAVGWLRAGDPPTTSPAPAAASGQHLPGSIDLSGPNGQVLKDLAARRLREVNSPNNNSNVPVTATVVNSHIPVDDPTDPVAAAVNGRVVARLFDTIPSVHFENQPLRDCVSFFRDVTKLNVVVNWQALQAAGIDMATPITLDLQSVTAEKLLQQMLAAAAQDDKVDYEIRDGIVTIATAESLGQRVETRVYDVADLLTNNDPLANALESSVMPGTWRGESGGSTNNTIVLLGNKLIVTTSSKGQRRVANFLQQLRNPISKPG